jgi:hypothetical protein
MLSPIAISLLTPRIYNLITGNAFLLAVSVNILCLHLNITIILTQQSLSGVEYDSFSFSVTIHFSS